MRADLRLLALLVGAMLVLAACGGPIEPVNEDAGDDTAAAGDDDTGDDGAGDDDIGADDAGDDGMEDDAADDGGDAAGDEPAGEDVLVYGTVNPPASIDPAKCYDSTCSNILFNITDQLVSVAPGEQEVGPSIAESWEVSDDGLEYVFTLQEGVTFHDGSELTADDVVFSINRVLDINHPDGAAYLYEAIDSVEATGDQEVTITLSEANATFLARLNYSLGTILPSDGDTYTAPDGAVDEGDEDADRAAAEEFIVEDTVVGSGPYQVTSYQPGEQLTLEAFEDYWGEAPAIDTVRVQFFADSSQMANALAAGEIDLVLNEFGPSEAASLEGGDGVEITEEAGGVIRYIVFDVTQEPVDDPEVRRAISASIDRQRLVDEVFDGAGAPLTSMIPDFYDVAADYVSDVEAGDLPDTPIPLTLHYPLNRYGDTEPDVAETIARSLDESGLFEVDTVGVDWVSEYSANISTGTYNMFLLGWYPDYVDPDIYVEPFYNSAGFLGYYDNPDMDALIQTEQQSLDDAERDEAFDQIQQLAAEDMPVIPLYEGGQIAYHADWVTGIEDTLDAAQELRFWVLGR